MKFYKVEMVIKIDDECLDDWIPQAINENLEMDNGEEIVSFTFTELETI